VAVLESAFAAAGVPLIAIASKAGSDEFNSSGSMGTGNKAEVLSRCHPRVDARMMATWALDETRILWRQGTRPETKYGRLLQQQFPNSWSRFAKGVPSKAPTLGVLNEADLKFDSHRMRGFSLPVAWPRWHQTTFTARTAMLAFNRCWCARLPECDQWRLIPAMHCAVKPNPPLQSGMH